MILKMHVVSSANVIVPAVMLPMSVADAALTVSEPAWQTDWNSDFIMNSEFEKYALKTENNELLALAAYEKLEKMLALHIVYAESSPESNPTITKKKKYTGIGKAIIAYGIKLSVDYGYGGTLLFEAKTSTLADYYRKTFNAIPLPMGGNLGPQRFLIDGETAIDIISEYLE